jgi:hypothetical protein
MAEMTTGGAGALAAFPPRAETSAADSAALGAADVGYPHVVIGCANCALGSLASALKGWRCRFCRWTGGLHRDALGRLVQG